MALAIRGMGTFKTRINYVNKCLILGLKAWFTLRKITIVKWRNSYN